MKYYCKGRQSTSTTEYQSFHLCVLQVLASTQSFQLLVLYLGTREYPVISAVVILHVLANTQSVISYFRTLGTESFKITGTRHSLTEYQ